MNVMRNCSWVVAMTALSTASVVALSARVAVADDTKRVVSVKQIMQGLVKPNCGAIGGLLEDAGPADDDAWGQVAMHAALLNETGHLLIQNNRCPSAVWADATRTLRGGAAKLADAAGKKDLAATRAAFKEATSACKTCHDEHKSKPVPPLPARFAGVGHLMAGITQPNCVAIGKALKDDGPKDAKAWEAVFQSAAMLNEVGFLLMDNKRCPSAAWKDAATGLRTAAAKVGQAAQAKDLAATKAGFSEVTKTCEKCHKAHKGKKKG